MNRQRRKDLDKVHTMLMKIIDEIENAINDLEAVAAFEEEARDNMPESLWDSERYQQMDDNVDTLEDGTYSLRDAHNTIEEVMGDLWDMIHPES